DVPQQPALLTLLRTPRGAAGDRAGGRSDREPGVVVGVPRGGGRAGLEETVHPTGGQPAGLRQAVPRADLGLVVSVTGAPHGVPAAPPPSVRGPGPAVQGLADGLKQAGLAPARPRRLPRRWGGCPPGSKEGASSNRPGQSGVERPPKLDYVVRLDEVQVDAR